MHPYPHTYRAAATGTASGSVAVTSAGLPEIRTAAPPQFDGPEGFWSPETLLCAAVADCYILTFRALSRPARLQWLELTCRVEGALERVDGIPQFTHYALFADLTVPEGTDVEKARSLLEKTETSCLVSNSLRGSRTLSARVVTAVAAQALAH